MPRRQWLFIAATFCVVVAIAVAQLSRPAMPPSHAEHNQNTETKGSGTSQQNGQTKSLWQAIVSPADPLVPLNLLLVLATLGLAGATLYLAFITRKSVDIAERALTELERPYIVIDIPQEGIAVSVSGEKFTFVAGQVRWEVVNYGRTPAILIDRLITWPIEAGEAMPYAIDSEKQRGPQFPNGCVAGVNGEHPYRDITNLTHLPNTQNLVPFGSWSTHRLFSIGYIRYGDLFGGVCVNGFCLAFNPHAMRFDRIGGEEYNYTRTEKKTGSGQL